MDARTLIVRGLLAAIGAAAASAANASCFGPPAHSGCGQRPESPRDWHVHMGGASVHSSETNAPGRRWNERHSGFGAELRVPGLPWHGVDRTHPWRTTYTFGTFADSRSVQSYYTGTAVSHPLMRIGNMQLDGGAGAFLFYRSRSWSGRMALTPAVLPVLSLTDRHGGAGLNLTWRPPGFGGPGTVFLQVTRPLQP